MSLPRRFARSVISSYALAGVVALSALVMTPILVRGLGAEAYGVWALASALALYFKLLEFGVGKGLPQYVAEHAVTSDDAALSRAISTAMTLLGGLALASLAVAVALVAAFPSLFDVPPGLRTAAQIAVGLVLLDLCLSLVSDSFGWTLTGLQRFDLINATLIAVVVAQSVAWAIVLWSGGGLIELAVVTVAISLAGQGARYALTRRLLPGLRIAPRAAFDRRLVRPFVRRSAWIGLIDLASVVVFRLDVILVGLILGIRGAAVYSVAQKLSLALEQLIAATTKAFFPHASELAAREDLKGLRESLLTGTRASLLVATPLALTLCLLAGPIVDAWVGSGFEDAAPVIVYLACAAIIVALTRTGLLMIQGVGTPRTTGLIYGGEALLNVTLSVGLGFAIGIEGVALGTLIAGALGAIVFVPYLCGRFGLRLHEFLGPLLRAHLPGAAAALGLGLLMTRGPLDGVALAATAATMVAGYLLVFVATGLDGDERRRLRALLFSRG